MLGITTM